MLRRANMVKKIVNGAKMKMSGKENDDGVGKEWCFCRRSFVERMGFPGEAGKTLIREEARAKGWEEKNHFTFSVYHSACVFLYFIFPSGEKIHFFFFNQLTYQFVNHNSLDEI